jgi:ribosome-binding ATPase YchF (GTP1/OBG family)
MNKRSLRGLFLLTSKPVIYVANIAESSMADPESDKYYQIVKKHAESENAEALGISAATEEEIASMDEDERKEFLEMEGVEESGLDRLIKAAYHILGLRTFFTAGGPETRAWTFHEGMKAPQVAGVIHSDFERGFIRAEVVSFDDLDKLETMQKVKEAGKLRLEGKDYVVQDGDIIEFRFNV